MKTKIPTPEKVRLEPRVDCRENTTYSEGALAIMEQATGMRYAKPRIPVKEQVAAVDAE